LKSAAKSHKSKNKVGEVTMQANAARRLQPVGVLAGAPLTRVDGPQQALGLVAGELALAEGQLRELLVSDVRDVTSITGYLVEAGGKRLRPAMTALGVRAVKGTSVGVERLMCVGELIHLGSLLHDDVVDQAETRRGKQAAHHLHGNAATILSGDYCLARAVLVASEVGGHVAVTALAEAVTAMAEGEVLQLRLSGNLGCTQAEYFEVIERKSAALIAWCTAAGAYRAGEKELAEALHQYGWNVGIAFQITDDVLDYSEGTGKQPGADLKEGKMTLPLMYALDVFPELREKMKAGSLNESELADWVQRIRESGVLDRALQVAKRYVDDGLVALNRLEPSEARSALAVLGMHLVERVR
jgi:octaprenyl-diphosphate synthase